MKLAVRKIDLRVGINLNKIFTSMQRNCLPTAFFLTLTLLNDPYFASFGYPWTYG